MGRLLPIDDPNHVTFFAYDSESFVIELLVEDKVIDGMGSNSPPIFAGAITDAMYHLAILGDQVPSDIQVPSSVLTADNLYTQKLCGIPLAWSVTLPVADWDKWPVLDYTDLGFKTATKLEGY